MHRHMIIARGAYVFAQLTAERSHVGDDLPDLLVGNFAAKGRHSVGTAFDYSCMNLLGGAAVNPFVIHQRRAHAAAAVGMTADTVVPGEEPLAFGNCPGVFIEGSFARFCWQSDGSHFCRWRARCSWLKLGLAHRRRPAARRGDIGEFSLFSFASGEERAG